MKVEATMTGYYDHAIRKKGDVFSLKDKKHFSHLWMKALDFKPEPPSENVKKLLTSEEYKAKLSEFKFEIPKPELDEK